VTNIPKRHLGFVALGVVALGLFALVDLPQTVRIKALFVNLLPLDAKTKVAAIENLCSGAYAASSYPAVSTCRSVNVSSAAEEEMTRRRKEIRDREQEVADAKARSDQCEMYKQRMTKGNLQSEWDTRNVSSYTYVGSDPEMKGWTFSPLTCELRDPAGEIYFFKP
jgi:hypothetical protein